MPLARARNELPRRARSTARVYCSFTGSLRGAVLIVRFCEYRRYTRLLSLNTWSIRAFICGSVVSSRTLPLKLLETSGLVAD